MLLNLKPEPQKRGILVFDTWANNKNPFINEKRYAGRPARLQGASPRLRAPQTSIALAL